LYGSDNVTGVEGFAHGTNAGHYIDALANATGSGLDNYDVTYVNGTLDIYPNDAPDYGGKGDSGSSGGGVAASLAIAGGAMAFLLDNHNPYLHLPSPDHLEATGGDPGFWADPDIEYIVVNLDTGVADVQLLASAGRLKRQLKYTDMTDGVNHYNWQNETPTENYQSLLSVNTQTREYFYTEVGIQNGKPYTVKAHGWLKRGLLPEMMEQIASTR
jgi:hypothetical protein